MTEVLDPGDCSGSRPAQWWALSPLDLHGHLLLPGGCHPKGVLKARCGHLLPMMAMRFGLLRAVLVSTIVVVALNVLLPVYAAYALRSFRYWAELAEIDKMSEEDSTARLRELLTTRGRLSVQEFDDAYSMIKQGLRVEGPPAERIAKAMMRAMILGRDGVFGLTLGRTVAYYLMKVLMRGTIREGYFTYHADDDTLKDETDDPPTGQADKRGVAPSVRTRAPSNQDGSSRSPG